MRIIRYTAWAAVAALALLAAGLYATNGTSGSDGRPVPQLSLGGPFTLTTDEGKRLSSDTLKGKPFAIFFGFTYCPDICPTTLMELTTTIEAMGEDAGRMRFLFVTVDPERDTPDQLDTYLSSFDPRITGLTGTKQEIAQIAKAYRVYYEKVPTDGDYTMNHSSLIYLMDDKGEFVDVLAHGTDPDQRLTKLKQLVGAV